MPGNGALRAEDRTAERLAGIGFGKSEVEDDVVRAVLGRGDLLKNHLALPVHLLVAEGRIEQQIADQIQAQLHVVFQNARVIVGGLR